MFTSNTATAPSIICCSGLNLAITSFTGNLLWLLMSELSVHSLYFQSTPRWPPLLQSVHHSLITWLSILLTRMSGPWEQELYLIYLCMLVVWPTCIITPFLKEEGEDLRREKRIEERSPVPWFWMFVFPHPAKGIPTFLHSQVWSDRIRCLLLFSFYESNY